MSIRNHFIAISSKNFDPSVLLADFGSAYWSVIRGNFYRSVPSGSLQPTTIDSPGNAQPLRAVKAVVKAAPLSA